MRDTGSPSTRSGVTVNRATRERGEDALVGLPRQVPVARLAERRARPSRRLLEQLVEAGARHHQQPVGGARAGDGEAAELRS